MGRTDERPIWTCSIDIATGCSAEPSKYIKSVSRSSRVCSLMDRFAYFTLGCYVVIKLQSDIYGVFERGHSSGASPHSVLSHIPFALESVRYVHPISSGQPATFRAVLIASRNPLVLLCLRQPEEFLRSCSTLFFSISLRHCSTLRSHFGPINAMYLNVDRCAATGRRSVGRRCSVRSP